MKKLIILALMIVAIDRGTDYVLARQFAHDETAYSADDIDALAMRIDYEKARSNPRTLKLAQPVVPKGTSAGDAFHAWLSAQ